MATIANQNMTTIHSKQTYAYHLDKEREAIETLRKNKNIVLLLAGNDNGITILQDSTTEKKCENYSLIKITYQPVTKILTKQSSQKLKDTNGFPDDRTTQTN